MKKLLIKLTTSYLCVSFITMLTAMIYYQNEHNAPIWVASLVNAHLMFFGLLIPVAMIAWVLYLIWFND